MMPKEPPFSDGPYLTGAQAQRYYENLTKAIADGLARSALDVAAIDRIIFWAKCKRRLQYALVGLFLGCLLALAITYTG